MKKLKNLFSFILVAVFALTGTLMFTGCKIEEQPKEDITQEQGKVELTQEQKIEIVKNVLNDTISKLEVAQMFEEGDIVKPKSEVTNSIFAEFGNVVVNGATEFETLTSDYINILTVDSEVEMTVEVSNVILEVVELEDFEFDTKVTYMIGGTEEINVKLSFNENNFIFGIYGEEDIFSFYKFNYSNNLIISVEVFENGMYDRIVISTDISKRALDCHVSILKRTEQVSDVNVSGYLCSIYSEAEGKCYTEAWDMVITNPESILNFIVGSETYGEMVDACKAIIDANQTLLESLN